MAAEGNGDRYADETGMRRSTLLGMPPDQVVIKVPSLIKGPAIAGIIGLIFAVVGFLGCYMYTTMPDTLDTRPTTTRWRVTTDADYTSWSQWEVCALIPYSDDNCKNLIDFSDAEVSALPALPDGWKDYTSKAAAPGAVPTCTAPWVASSGARSDLTPYIEWKFPKATKVGCFKVQYTRPSFSWSEAEPTIIQAEKDGKWVVQRRDEYGSYAEWNSISSLPNRYEDDAQGNPYKVPALITGIICAVFGGVTLLIVLPLVLCELYMQKKQRQALQEEVREGKTLIFTTSESQWAAFVEEQWGPGGVVHQEQVSWWLWIIATVVLGTIATVLVKLRSMARGHDLEWFWCGVIGMGVSCLVMFFVWVSIKLERRLRYNFLKKGKHPAVLGTSSVYFAHHFVKGSDILASSVVTSSSGPAAGKTRLVLIYKFGSNETKKMSMPVADNQVEEVEAFIREYSGTYAWCSPRTTAPVESAAPRRPTAPPATGSGVTMVSPESVRVMEMTTD